MAPHNEDDMGESGNESGGLLDETAGRWPVPQWRKLKMEDTWNRWKLWVVSALSLVLGIALGILLSNFPGPFDTGKTGSAASIFAPIKPVTFQPDTTYSNATAPDEATDKAWANLNPVGRGFVRIDAEGQPVPYDGTDGDLAHTKSVAVFHQLHCLDMLRRSLIASAANPLEYSYLVPQHSHHWSHCFDYLRQTLMCAADVTYEKLQTKADGTLLDGVDGWGTTHMCRDYQAVKEWATTHRSSDSEGIAN
ncbi:hypothetical protein B0T19DRAFT_263126 [Cercophora scortea]|uniref:Oxidase ustYa n=1 Tax=Cercophora scortea TaxID=314031 RepID=A0AAE0IAE6_9PEZI|nr:hypothetical protein B0T19DRAFT_263126 [Cercophora scortea]